MAGMNMRAKKDTFPLAKSCSFKLITGLVIKIVIINCFMIFKSLLK